MGHRIYHRAAAKPEGYVAARDKAGIGLRVRAGKKGDIMILADQLFRKK